MKFATVRKFALSLPDATEQPHHQRTSFRAGGKIFATAPADEASVNIFVAEEDRERMLAIEPDAFEKLLWGGKVVGVRVELALATAAYVTQSLYLAWKLKAPKKLVASFDPPS